MRMKDVVLVTLVLALGATSLGLWRALEAERDRAEVIQDRLASLELNVPRHTLAGERGHIAAMGNMAGVESSERPSTLSTLDLSGTTQLGETFWEARRGYMRVQLGATYGDVGQVLGIDEAKGKALIDLLTDQRYQNERAANEPGNKSTAEEWEHALVERRQENQAEIASFLGERDFAKWNDYQASLPTRTLVRDFGRELALTREPLKSDQVEPLVAMIHSERMKSRQELGEYQLDMYPGDNADWEAFNEVVFGRRVELMEAADQQIVKSASSVLSIAQVDALEKMLKRERDLYGARFQMMEAGKRPAIGVVD